MKKTLTGIVAGLLLSTTALAQDDFIDARLSSQESERSRARIGLFYDELPLNISGFSYIDYFANSNIFSHNILHKSITKKLAIRAETMHWSNKPDRYMIGLKYSIPISKSIKSLIKVIPAAFNKDGYIKDRFEVGYLVVGNGTYKLGNKEMGYNLFAFQWLNLATENGVQHSYGEYDFVTGPKKWKVWFGPRVDLLNNKKFLPKVVPGAQIKVFLNK